MIIVAIDENNFKKASELINKLDPKKCMVKIGSVAFNSIGHEIIYYAADHGFKIFLDLKLHDIPNTVKKSIQGLASLPIRMLTVHTSGGKDMMKWSEKNSLMNRNIDLEDVGKSGLYLLSNLSSGVTGETHYVDCGYNIVGVPKEI